MTTEQDSVADTIFAQIVGTDPWARARWGVKQPLAVEHGLQLNCTKNIKIVIKLVDDTYHIEVGRYYPRNFSYKAHAARTGVYAEDLVRNIDSLFSASFGGL